MNSLVMLKSPTLLEVWEIYKEVRILKSLTITDYDKKLRTVAEFANRRISGVTKQEVIDLHNRLIEERGLATANYVMRIISALMQFSIEALEFKDGEPVLLHNPARVILAIRAAAKPKDEHPVQPINQTDLATWYAAVQRHPSSSIRDWMIFMLRTGARRTEATELRHEDIDGANALLGRRKVPLSTQIMEIVYRRSVNRGLAIRVFEGRSNGKISDWNKSSLRLSRESGVRFTPYQLRLTYRAVAISIGIPETHINRLMRGRDEFVTSQLTSSQQAISDEIDRLVLPRTK
jgi:hypothetical protein